VEEFLPVINVANLWLAGPDCDGQLLPMLPNSRLSRAAILLLALSSLTAGAAKYTPEEIAAESAKATAFFDRKFDEFIARSPETMTYLGMKKDYDKWNDDSEPAQIETLKLAIAAYEELKRTIDFDKLDAAAKVNYRLWTRNTENQISGWQWRHHDYPVNQMFGQHANIPAFLINAHRVDNVDDARAYISRLRSLDVKFDNLIREITVREEKGVMPPKFVFPLVLAACNNMLKGAPFDDSGKDSALFEDIGAKVAKLADLSDEDRAALIGDARTALLEVVAPAYKRLIAKLEEQATSATTDDGVWKHPQGDDYYNRTLLNWTTTRLTADRIHEIGMSEVDRILAQMDAIREQVGFKGSRKEFAEFLRNDPQFFFPETEEGKQQYLARVNAALGAIRAQLPSIFKTLPKAELTVKAVEPFREAGAAEAFYQRPSLDGARPGIYYVNFHKMSALPVYQLEATAYHEGLPGHHMQIAIAQELTDVPKFRKFGFGASAYTEGWGLYSERLGKELGGYADPYSEFGRLSLELLRAGRLVADTGLHSKSWTREQAIEWMSENLPLPLATIKTEVERYIVLPGQATSYKIGQLKILDLREKARKELGEKFELAEFHDVVLRNGALPLENLEEFVDEWIAVKKG
jgi:uncharacterized protein (DUF885 family)